MFRSAAKRALRSSETTLDFCSGGLLGLCGTLGDGGILGLGRTCPVDGLPISEPNKMGLGSAMAAEGAGEEVFRVCSGALLGLCGTLDDSGLLGLGRTCAADGPPIPEPTKVGLDVAMAAEDKDTDEEILGGVAKVEPRAAADSTSRSAARLSAESVASLSSDAAGMATMFETSCIAADATDARTCVGASIDSPTHSTALHPELAA